MMVIISTAAARGSRATRAQSSVASCCSVASSLLLPCPGLPLPCALIVTAVQEKATNGRNGEGGPGLLSAATDSQGCQGPCHWFQSTYVD